MKHLSESKEDIAVVKIMLKSFDTVGNTLVREFFRRIRKRFKRLYLPKRIWDFGTCIEVQVPVVLSGSMEKIICRGQHICRKMVAIFSKLSRI